MGLAVRQRHFDAPRVAEEGASASSVDKKNLQNCNRKTYTTLQLARERPVAALTRRNKESSGFEQGRGKGCPTQSPGFRSLQPFLAGALGVAGGAGFSGAGLSGIEPSGFKTTKSARRSKPFQGAESRGAFMSRTARTNV